MSDPLSVPQPQLTYQGKRVEDMSRMELINALEHAARLLNKQQQELDRLSKKPQMFRCLKHGTPLHMDGGCSYCHEQF